MDKTILGIDEAGRGPVIGPLVMAAVKINEKDEKKLIELGVKDSKLLLPSQREYMFDKILEIADSYKIIIIPPLKIDEAVNSETTNLNWLEADNAIDMINELNPAKAYIDCPSTNIAKYTEYLQKKLTVKTKLVVEHKADFTYPVVSAASILAKVTRDREIEKIKEKIGMNLGSGYPSDPMTQEFLKNNWKTHPDVFRHSWASYKNYSEGQSQKKLFDFSDKPEKESDKKKIKELDILIKYGFSFTDLKSEHEAARLKGPSTVILYKSGTLLVQGTEEDKKFVNKILKRK
jgi:ribonuclease HII